MPITKNTSASEIIDDFVHSKNPKFAGKSKEERRKMALGAYYSMHKEDIDDVVALTVNGNRDDATQIISNILMDKVASRLEDFKVDVAQKYFDLKNESKDEDWSDRAVAIQHPNATKEHIDKALNDTNPFVRDAVIEHPKATKEHLDKALNDRDLSIRRAARNRLE